MLKYVSDQDNEINYSNAGAASSRTLIAEKLSKWFWLIWVVVLMITFIIQLSTIDVQPNFPKDEAQITDYGRLFFNPQSDWSINWLLIEGKPVLLWSYLGPLLSELSFQMFGSSGLGPRIMALAGGLVAASMMLLLQLSRKVPGYAAWWLSLAFLLDPLFGLSQRLGRVDSWVIALCLTSCWLLRRSAGGKDYNGYAQVMAAGGIAVTASFMWPSAVLLYPLIALELVQLVQFERALGRSWKSVISKGFLLLAGGLLVGGLLIVPIWQDLELILNDAAILLTKNVESSQSVLDRLYSLFGFPQWLKAGKAFGKTLSIILPIFALTGALVKRDKSLILVSFIAVALIFTTLIYELRVLYLLPYLILLAGGFFEWLAERPAKSKNYRIAVSSLIVIAGWAVMISLLVRTALGFNVKDKLDRSRIQQVATTSIGKDSVKVYLANTYEFYYPGRALGWKQYTPYAHFEYDAEGNWIDKGYVPKEKFLKLFSEMDYAIFLRGTITNDLAELLKQSGLTYDQTLFGNESSVHQPGISRARRMITWYLRGSTHYGPYVLFKNPRLDKAQF